MVGAPAGGIPTVDGLVGVEAGNGLGVPATGTLGLGGTGTSGVAGGTVTAPGAPMDGTGSGGAGGNFESTSTLGGAYGRVGGSRGCRGHRRAGARCGRRRARPEARHFHVRRRQLHAARGANAVVARHHRVRESRLGSAGRLHAGGLRCVSGWGRQVAAGGRRSGRLLGRVARRRCGRRPVRVRPHRRGRQCAARRRWVRARLLSHHRSQGDEPRRGHHRCQHHVSFSHGRSP